VSVQSCSENEDIIFAAEQKVLLDSYASVGEKHNLMTDEIYKQLKSIPKLKGNSKSVLSKDDAIEEVKHKTIDVIGYDIYSHKGVKDVVDKSFYFPKRGVRLKNGNQESNIDSIINNPELSSTFKQLYKELIVISDSYTLSIEQQKEKIDRFNLLAFELLDNEELEYILIGSSVSAASFEYWHTNMEEWLQLVVRDKKIRLKSGNENFWLPGGGLYDGMTGADVGGAVGGAITGGVGAGPGALIGGVAGGVGASTGQVVDNIGEYLGWW
jgi:hypothetical protein